MKKISFILVTFISASTLLSCNTHKPNAEVTTETKTETTTTTNTEPGIHFVEDKGWSDILAMAKKENKPVLVDIYASWCGPCKLLKKETFPNEEAGKFFNANFISTSFDGEKGDGIALAQQFKIQGYPTLIIVNPDGSFVSQSVGFIPAENLIAFGKDALTKVKH